jgi:hypothetical protein
MRSNDFVHIDVRWREDGWLEAMRLYIAGWLPEHLAAQGIKKGVLATIMRPEGKYVVLTARGKALTEPRSHSFTNENLWQIAEFLRVQDYSSDWLQAADKDAVRFAGKPLDATYRTKLLTYLDPANEPKESRLTRTSWHS